MSLDEAGRGYGTDGALAEALTELLGEQARSGEPLNYEGDELDEIESVSTFEEVGMLTMNAGVLIRLRGGEKFALSISRYSGCS